MAFDILLSIAVLFCVWILVRSRVMRACLRGRTSDPSGSAIRTNELYRGATWRDDG